MNSSWPGLTRPSSENYFAVRPHGDPPSRKPLWRDMLDGRLKGGHDEKEEQIRRDLQPS